MNRSIKYYCLFALFLMCITSSFSQIETSKWKALIALGVNSPSQSGFVESFEANSLNFPTINLGVQRMFTQQVGAKLDFGYNRFTSTNNSPEFKINYSRINAQLVYDATRNLTFLPINMGVVAHAGPGYSIVKPLSGYSENKTSYLNAMTGIEVHYGVSKTVSVFVDGSYVLGFAKDFDPITDGYGSFNGNLFTATIGISVSLSGCTYCN